MSEERYIHPDILLLKKDLDAITKKRNLELELIKRDVSDLVKVYTKMDATLDRMQQVSSDLSKVITAHEYKLQAQDKDAMLSKTNDDKVSDRIDRINHKIENINNTVQNKMDSLENSLLGEISNLKIEFKQMTDNMNKKVYEIDIWRYTIMGGMILASFLVTKFLDVAKILS